MAVPDFTPVSEPPRAAGRWRPHRPWARRAPAIASAGAGPLSALSATQHEILRLRVVVGLSVEETAAMLGSTPDAVRLIQHHALDVLREKIAIQDPPGT
jgi:hypothetical protein